MFDMSGAARSARDDRDRLGEDDCKKEPRSRSVSARIMAGVSVCPVGLIWHAEVAAADHGNSSPGQRHTRI